jgi:hypothetical protein
MLDVLDCDCRSGTISEIPTMVALFNETNFAVGRFFEEGAPPHIGIQT